MKRFICLAVLAIALTFFTSQLYAGDKATKQFEKIKSLEGEWRGTGEDEVKVSYEVVSNGSAVIERMKKKSEPNMITMYHLDGDQLMMTHYCSAMNQPRMRANISNDNDDVIDFTMFDITNCPNPADGHMKKLVMTIKDDKHIAHQWTFAAAGNPDMNVPIELERK